MTRAAVYMRVSTVRQAHEDKNSLPVQRAEWLRYCAEQGYEPGPEWQDAESGRSNTRPGYRGMLAAAARGEFDVLCVTFLDRLGRDDREMLRRVLQLEDAGITIECIHEDVSDFIMLALSAWKAGAESKRNSERVRLNQAAAVVRGARPGVTAYGYRREGGALVVYEPEAAVVREVYRLYVHGGHGWAYIAAELNRRGVPIPPNSDRNAFNAWTANAVRAMLMRRTYTGTFTWGDVSAPCPVIVDAETWQQAQDVRERRRGIKGTASRSDYLLSGISWCGHCGGRMNGSRSTPTRGTPAHARGVVYPRYGCVNRRKSGTCAYANHHRKDEAEAAVLDDVRQHVARRREVYEVDPEPALRAELRDVEHAIESAGRHFAANLRAWHAAAMTDAQFAEANRLTSTEHDTLTARRAVLVGRIDALGQHRADRARRAEAAATIAQRAGELSPQDLKAMLQAVIARVVFIEDDPWPRVEFR